MRRIVTFTLAVAVGGCFTTPDEGGPAHGRWLLDTGPNEGWYCVRAGAVCSAPAYFSPLPTEVEIESGGVLDWSGPYAHAGAVDGACIRVPAAREEGVARTEATFCNLVAGDVVDETRAFAIIGWSPGTAEECTCSAHFDLADG